MKLNPEEAERAEGGSRELLGETRLGDDIEKREVIDVYRRRAKNYDLEAMLLSVLLGLRLGPHRELAIESLDLRKGDAVVEIGCGTGANFLYLEKAVEGQGRIIGVDQSSEMLREAEERVREQGWKNVTLVNCDASSFNFPRDVEGILSTLAITLVPEFDRVISNAAEALAPGRHFVIMDFKMPSDRLAKNWVARRLAPILFFVGIKPFGGKMEMATRHPWESLFKYLTKVSFKEIWLGGGYIATAVRSAGTPVVGNRSRTRD